jgi:glycosyltransferase involved in cell wall biosynthesis
MVTLKGEQPLVSVIVITYNSANFVIETLESVRNQSYNLIELIISDDCSNDTTLEICMDWLKENSYRFIRSELLTVSFNTGIPANCNRGVYASEGEWVKVIAGDDKLESNCIKDNLDYIHRYPEVLVLFSCMNVFRAIFSANNFIEKHPASPPLDFINESIDANCQYRMLLIRNRIGFVASSFISKEVLVKVGGFDEKYRLHEDNPMWLKLTKAGFKLYFMDIVTVSYRRHENSITYLPQNDLVNKTFLEQEEFRREYIYPFLEAGYKLDYWYRYRISLIVYRVFSNKSTRFSRFTYNLIMKWINPFYYYLTLKRLINILLGKNIDAF